MKCSALFLGMAALNTASVQAEDEVLTQSRVPAGICCRVQALHTSRGHSFSEKEIVLARIPGLPSGFAPRLPSGHTSRADTTRNRDR